MHFIALSTSSLWFVDASELLRGSSAHDGQWGENDVSEPEDMAALSVDQVGIQLEKGAHKMEMCAFIVQYTAPLMFNYC